MQVVITPAGKEFITPITLSALTHKPVISEFFAQRDGTWNSHVDLGLWADAMLIAPCTASTLGKMANGIADNMLITTYLSMKAPVFIAPAMDLDMYQHPTTQQNMERLKSFGNTIIEPATGFLASGLEGKGRMEEPARLVEVIIHEIACSKDMEGINLLVTAGPTREAIDPVRYITNHSTGKMGVAVAKAAACRGAKVTLVAGPIDIEVPSYIDTVRVTSAKEMFDAVTGRAEQQDIIIKAAAVADYTPETYVDDKIKKSDNDSDLSIKLARTQDILGWLGDHKKNGQILCGFSMETKDMLENSRKKLVKKNLDMICANNLKTAGAGFGVDTNVITLITEEKETELELMSKDKAAHRILSELLSIRSKKQ